VRMARQWQGRQRGAAHVREAGWHRHLTPIKNKNPALAEVLGGAVARVVAVVGTPRIHRPTAAPELERVCTEADAIERIRLNLWASCRDFPLADLRGWRATHLREHLWSVTATWTHPPVGYWYLEWQLDELGRHEKPANQATAVFEDIVRSWSRTFRPF
jgi:hypothetical protein